MDSAREARRRKILERGSDRLALITGQTQSIPQSSITATSATTVASPLSSEQVAASSEDVPTDFEFPKSEPSKENVLNKVDSGDVDHFPKFEEITEAANIPSLANANVAPSAIQSSSDHVTNTATCGVQNSNHQVFTANRITSCISVSENVRLLCAVTIALLVVLSHHGYPVGGDMIRRIINFRPIYLVLVTDATLLLGLLLGTQGGKKVQGNTARTGQVEYHWTDQMGLALETALLFHKVLSAAFMDCCVCAVIMISGIPFGSVMGAF